ncbi:peptidyl-tRNA hydrolase [Candidatus Woesearchaeota archaeon]|nr:MAG: peptidyl-tRNA hydrolase [Candidatus Woesearchaeota archaeon]
MKQVIIVRADLRLPKGKAAAQAAHASVEAVLRSLGSAAGRERVKVWRQEGMAKIVLKAADEKELLRLLQLAKDEGCTTALITDAGRTVVEPGTRTCIAVGPADDDVLDALFGRLKLL